MRSQALAGAPGAGGRGSVATAPQGFTRPRFVQRRVGRPTRRLREQVDRLAFSRPVAAAQVSAPKSVGSGLDAESVLLDVIATMQGKVGAEWAANRISVVQEHAATSINERAVAALALHPAARTRPHSGQGDGGLRGR